MTLNIRHILPKKCIIFVFWLLPFLIIIIDATVKATEIIKAAVMKYQNRIMAGAFSINNTSLMYDLGKFLLIN